MERFLGVPVVSKGRTIGQLYLTNEASEPEFSPEDEEIMVLFARQAAVAILFRVAIVTGAGSRSNQRWLKET